MLVEFCAPVPLKTHAGCGLIRRGWDEEWGQLLLRDCGMQQFASWGLVLNLKE